MYEGVVLGGGGYSGYPGNVYLIFGVTSILFGQLVGDAMDLCGHNSDNNYMIFQRFYWGISKILLWSTHTKF